MTSVAAAWPGARLPPGAKADRRASIAALVSHSGKTSPPFRSLSTLFQWPFSACSNSCSLRSSWGAAHSRAQAHEGPGARASANARSEQRGNAADQVLLLHLLLHRRGALEDRCTRRYKRQRFERWRHRRQTSVAPWRVRCWKQAQRGRISRSQLSEPTEAICPRSKLDLQYKRSRREKLFRS
jgi:hypothetical protein